MNQVRSLFSNTCLTKKKKLEESPVLACPGNPRCGSASILFPPQSPRFATLVNCQETPVLIAICLPPIWN